MILLDYKDRRPIYEQVTEKFKTLILSGVLKEGDSMPSVRSLATSLSVNPNTIQRAYAKLEQDDFIYTVSGKGSFVSCIDTLMTEQKRDWFHRLDELVKEGSILHISPEEIYEHIKQADHSS